MNEKQLKEWKDALAKSGITYKTDDEYLEAMKNLAGFFDVLIQIDQQAKQNQIASKPGVDDSSKS